MKKKHLITSALTYINGLPHIGHLAGAMLNADIYARFLRAKGEDVLFVGGTDVHGTKIEVAAEQEGLSIKEYIKNHKVECQGTDALVAFSGVVKLDSDDTEYVEVKMNRDKDGKFIKIESIEVLGKFKNKINIQPQKKKMKMATKIMKQKKIRKKE